MSTTIPGASIPPGFTELLEEFAATVLREKPTDLVSFAASYFTNLREENSRNTNTQRTGPAPNSEEQHMESESMATDTPAAREMEGNGL